MSKNITKKHATSPVTIDVEASKRAQAIYAESPAWSSTTKSHFPMQFTGSHKYEVKAVTTPLVGTGKTVRTYCVSSIAQLVYLLNQDQDLIYKVNSEHYNTIKNGFITAHYIKRVY